MASYIARRKFLATLLGGAAAWPLAARAQQDERVRRIGIITNLPADDAEGQARIAAFLQGLQERGWAVGRNVRIDTRWGAGDAESIRRDTMGLITLAPDVIFANTTPIVVALQQATAMCLSCSRGSSIRSVPDWSQVWRGRVATPPALPDSNTA